MQRAPAGEARGDAEAGERATSSGRDWPLDAVAYADVIAREYLLFRGATGALKLFDAERADEDSRSKLFKVDRVMELLFQEYIPNYQVRAAAAAGARAPPGPSPTTAAHRRRYTPPRARRRGTCSRRSSS